MTKKLKRHKGLIKIAIIMVPVLFGWLYRELRPTVIFHTPQERKYLGKVLCTVSEDLDKLYIENHVVRYRLPYIWNWKEDDEAAFFIRNYADIIQKTDLDFWKLDVYLDENNFYLNHVKTEMSGFDLASYPTLKKYAICLEEIRLLILKAMNG